MGIAWGRWGWNLRRTRNHPGVFMEYRKLGGWGKYGTIAALLAKLALKASRAPSLIRLFEGAFQTPWRFFGRQGGKFELTFCGAQFEMRGVHVVADCPFPREVGGKLARGQAHATIK